MTTFLDTNSIKRLIENYRYSYNQFEDYKNGNQFQVCSSYIHDLQTMYSFEN